MKRKNAFTLIELLAIIVILAIIAVITVPIMLNIIENAKKGAVTASAHGYKDAINKYYLNKSSIDSSFDSLDGEYSINSNGYLSGTNETEEDVTYEISFTGNKPSRGFLTIKENEITGCIQFDEYKVEIENGKILTTEKGICKEPNYARKVITINENATTDYEKSPYINYVDKNGNTILCRALYNDQTHGLQIITSNIIENNIYMGAGDKLYDEPDEFKKAQLSYNNAIENLNNYAMNYLNTKYATDARSVGSESTVTNGMMENKNNGELLKNPNNYAYLESFISSGTMGTDTHYGETEGTDYYTMQRLNINKIDNEYWLASRVNTYERAYADFFVRKVGVGGGIIYMSLFRSAGNIINTTSAGLRAVFLLKENVVISSGTGTSADPYVLG